MNREPNIFFDINKLPAEEGLLVFPISMSRISNAQSAKACFEYMKLFSPSKIVKPRVGLQIIYSDYLYFHSDEIASELKRTFMEQMIAHKNAFLNILAKHPFYIENAVSFISWGQLYLSCKDVTNLFGKLKKRYKEDKQLQHYIAEDLIACGKDKLTEKQLNFFLEENLMSYLIAKGQVDLPNRFIDGHEKWILYCYPGKPLKSQAYLFQENLFDLHNPRNKFENCFYDMTDRICYDFTRIDIDAMA